MQEKESKLKQSEEELYARHREMKEQLDRQRQELEEKKSRIESGRPVEEKGRKKGWFLAGEAKEKNKPSQGTTTGRCADGREPLISSL